MKKLIASAGLVAIGATGLKAQYAPGLSRTESSKPWSISASLRGFYDDNYFAQPKDLKDDSFGFEVRPRVAFNLPREQTFIGGAYTYSMKYYDAREDDPIDHSHEVDLRIEHRFSERLKVNLNDNFVYAQEPEVVEGSGTTLTTFRTDADVMRNRASAEVTARATESLGVSFGYENGWYDYQDDNDPGSRSALLDRLEHLIRLDARWQANPDLVGIVGYQFNLINYTADEFLVAPTLLVPNPLKSGDRDTRSHFGYVGGEYTLSEELSFAGRVGVEYIEYTELDDTELSPYADVNGTYRYVPGSYVQVGVRHRHNPTDLAGTGTAGSVTKDQETTTLYGSVHHRITARIAANLVGQYQRSVFNGGLLDGDIDNFFLAGVNLQYEINQNWSAEAGYNYDRLDSDAGGRSFSRNRIYAGVRLQY
ncbi:MAG TPA: outer membrane beta-barrel protein [Verrucomicrobiae bacterium]|nr:outer membrane beta-barrel protein [Verrucomicrobiae bacterium]